MSNTPSAISSLSGLFGGGPGGSSGGGDVNPLAGMSLGSNQYAMYPSTPVAAASQTSGSAGAPGSVPTPTPLPGSTPTGAQTGAYYSAGGDVPYTNSQHIVPTEDPTLTQQYYSMLSGQAGQGLPSFDLSTVLPSSGQTTAPGQLNAPLNNVYQQLENLLTGGSSTLPGASQLTQMAQTGDPVNQTPAWQAMLASEQQNTAQNANNLREQFASSGNLSSSPFGNAMQQFYNQNAENQNAQLTAATTAEGDTAASRALNAQQTLSGLAGQTGQNLQSIDQSAIQNMLTEFNYTLPQNNPLMQYLSQAATFEPTVAGTPTTAQNFAGVAGGISSLLGSIL